MITISEILKPGDVKLPLHALEKAAAVDELLESLRGDERITDWDALRQAVIARDAAGIAEDGIGICIAHGRTNAVHSLVLAAGRCDRGISASEIQEPIRLFFVAAIPKALSQDYLRVLGAIARVCKSPEVRQQLLSVKEPARFIELLTQAQH